MLARSSIQTSGARSRPRCSVTSSGPAAADAGDRALDRADDVGEADLRRRPAEPVAAVGAALARDELGAAQLEQDVLEEVERDLLRGRELLALDRLPRRRRGELRKRAQRIVDLGRDPHARDSLGSRTASVGEPGRADRGDVAVVGATAAAEHVHARQR